ncbi:hypothetical protein ACI65C_007658 [Semiaphis heraclei]
MKCINTNKSIIPSITNWIKRIKGIMHICKRLLDCGFAIVLLRNFNQDPIEIFFGSIRNHGVRNIKPTPAMFISSFKALLINNFTSNHSVGSNCENDDCDGALDNLKNFLFDEVPLEDTNIQSPMESMIEIEIPDVKVPSSNSQVNSGSRAYVAGWILGILLLQLALTFFSY